jgi:hypothetical protein
VSFLYRRERACPREQRRSIGSASEGKGPGPRTAERPGRGRPKPINAVYISGVLADDPIRDTGRDGQPLMLLQVAFRAPDPSDADERDPMATTELEVPAPLLRAHGRKPVVGQEVLAVGQLSGGGGVLVHDLYWGLAPSDGRPT